MSNARIEIGMGSPGHRMTPSPDAVTRGRRLEYFTLAWNLVEAGASLLAGFLAGSIALVGFGFDSLIEVTSGGVLLWRLGAESDPARREHAERIALRLVGFCFLALAAYVAGESGRDLASRQAPGKSVFGIAVAVLSLMAMPLLARAKRRVARQLNSAAMHADSRQTDICAYLSAILLGGLGLNLLLGWWWADPVAALGMAPLVAWEGVQALRGRACCQCDPCGTDIASPGDQPHVAHD